MKCGGESLEIVIGSDDEDDQIIADVKRQSVLMMQVKNTHEDMDNTAGGATATEMKTVSMETGESQKEEEEKAAEEVIVVEK